MKHIEHLGSIQDIQPTVNFASHAADQEEGRSWGPRYIPDYQLFYLVSGEAEVSIGQSRYTLGRGDCALFGPAFAHRIVIVSRAVFFSLHFEWKHPSPEPVHPAYSLRDCPEEELRRHESGGFTLDMTEHDRLELPPVIRLPGIEHFFMRIVGEYLNEQPGYAILLRAMMIELIAAIVRQRLKERQPSPEYNKIEPALRAIRQYPEVNWSVPKLAALCGYHAMYFSSLFKKCTGFNPKEYLIAERIRLAKYYLLSGEKLEFIAERLGYTSIHYFSRNFKEETGLTPSEYRQQQQ